MNSNLAVEARAPFSLFTIFNLLKSFSQSLIRTFNQSYELGLTSDFVKFRFFLSVKLCVVDLLIDQ